MAPLADAIAEVWVLVVVFSLIFFCMYLLSPYKYFECFLAIFDPKNRVGGQVGTYSLKTYLVFPTVSRGHL